MAKNIIVAATGASGLPLLVECLKIIIYIQSIEILTRILFKNYKRKWEF